MVTIKKITEKEWEDYIDPQFVSNRFSLQMREALRAAFFNDLKDIDREEIQPLFSQLIPGITEKELNSTMGALRDSNSAISKSQDIHLYKYPKILDKAEGILREALKGNKERQWF